jgi:tetratricopeptide (TPR) repeat protein
MLCPKCGVEQKGEIANCINCGADLLPKKSLLKSRLPALILALLYCIFPWKWPRVLPSLASAFGPTLIGDRYRFRAEDLMESDPEQAVADFTKSLELMPSYVQGGRVRVLCLRAEVFKKLGKNAEAMADYEQALAKGEGVSSYYIPFSRDYVIAALDDLRIEMDPSAIEDETQRADVYCRQALAFYRRQSPDYAGAVKAATRAIELNDGMGEAYRIRGYAYFRLNRLREAIDDLGKAAYLVSDQNLARSIRRDVERLRATEKSQQNHG